MGNPVVPQPPMVKIFYAAGTVHRRFPGDTRPWYPRHAGRIRRSAVLRQQRAWKVPGMVRTLCNSAWVAFQYNVTDGLNLCGSITMPSHTPRMVSPEGADEQVAQAYIGRQLSDRHRSTRSGQVVLQYFAVDQTFGQAFGDSHPHDRNHAADERANQKGRHGCGGYRAPKRRRRHRWWAGLW